MLKHEIYNSSEKNIRLDIFLVNHIDDYSRSKIKKLINEGCIKVDNYSVKSSYKLKGLEYITIEDIETGHENYIEKENIPIDIIYEDKSFIIINKPAGLVVHPGAGNKKGTLLNGLLYHFNELSMMNDSRPGIIHRLDKNTSGVMIIAKSDRVHYMISEQFANRTVRKVYRAVVWGKLPDVGNIEGYIKRDKKNRTKFMLHDSKGKYSFTKYKKIKDNKIFSYIELYPLTGRTHQLRVHLKKIGYPIVLDETYGGGLKLINNYHPNSKVAIKKMLNVINRSALHAYKISFIHPIDNTKVIFKAPLPKDITKILEYIS